MAAAAMRASGSSALAPLRCCRAAVPPPSSRPRPMRQQLAVAAMAPGPVPQRPVQLEAHSLPQRPLPAPHRSRAPGPRREVRPPSRPAPVRSTVATPQGLVEAEARERARGQRSGRSRTVPEARQALRSGEPPTRARPTAHPTPAPALRRAAPPRHPTTGRQSEVERARPGAVRPTTRQRQARPNPRWRVPARPRPARQVARPQAHPSRARPAGSTMAPREWPGQPRQPQAGSPTTEPAPAARPTMVRQARRTARARAAPPARPRTALGPRRAVPRARESPRSGRLSWVARAEVLPRSAPVRRERLRARPGAAAGPKTESSMAPVGRRPLVRPANPIRPWQAWPRGMLPIRRWAGSPWSAPPRRVAPVWAAPMSRRPRRSGWWGRRDEQEARTSSSCGGCESSGREWRRSAPPPRG